MGFTSRFSDAVHSLKLISAAVLNDSDPDANIEKLFLDNDDDEDDNQCHGHDDGAKGHKHDNDLDRVDKSPTTTTTTTTTTNSDFKKSPKSKTASKFKFSYRRLSNSTSSNHNNAATTVTTTNNSSPITNISDTANVPTKQIPDNAPALKSQPSKGEVSWNVQRQQWLKPTLPIDAINKRKIDNSLSGLVQDNDKYDVYLAVYRNLVVYGKSLKRGINLSDGIKVIHAGWEQSKMYERVANGGVP